MRKVVFNIRNIRNIRKFFTVESCNVLVNSLVISPRDLSADNLSTTTHKRRWIYKSEVKSSRTHFEVLSLGVEASSPQKLPCPRLEDSTIFWTVEILLENVRNLAKNLRKPFGESPEKNFWRPFFENTCACVLGPWPWPRKGLSLALTSEFVCVLGLERVCPWPWPQNFFVSLALASNLVSLTPLLLQMNLKFC